MDKSNPYADLALREADLVAAVNYEFARDFESFPQDADRSHPGWRNALYVAS